MSVDYKVHGTVAVLTLNNPPVNAISRGVRDGLAEGIKRAVASSEVNSVVVFGKPTFSAGADITEFSSKSSPNKSLASSLSDVISLLELSPKPVLAAINGYAFGGGLEIALGCHYRFATKTSKVGLPEVSLGILPGAGGTQRLPRLVGVQHAAQIIVSGKPIPADKAKKFGIVDEVVDGGSDFLDRAVSFWSSADSSRVRPTRNLPIPEAATASAFLDGHLALVKKQSRGLIAPVKCIEAIAAAVNLPFEEGLKKERDLFLELNESSQSKALQYFFFAEKEASKLTGSTAKPAPLKTIGILGAGTMGGGIAMAAANGGLNVLLLDNTQELLERGLQSIKHNYEVSVKRGSLTPQAVAQAIGRIQGTIRFEDFAKADLIIEAVFENMDLKKQIFARLDKTCPPKTILCSNTSSLDIDEIASATSPSRREKVMGTHFFSPANVMRLLENVRGKDSSAETLATGQELGKILRKVPVLVGNCPSFAANRIFKDRSTEGGFLLEEGAFPQDVDKIHLKFGFPMGLFQVSDLSGIDIGVKIMNELKKSNPGVKFVGSPLSSRLVDAGRLGQKTKAGWYQYDDGRTPKPDPVVEKIIVERSKEIGIERRKISDDEILERVVYTVINEGFRVIEEGIVSRPSDLDVISVYGYGWPKFTGGPIFYGVNVVGIKKVYNAIEKYAKRYPDRVYWQPSKLLKALAEDDALARKFNLRVPYVGTEVHRVLSAQQSPTSRL